MLRSLRHHWRLLAILVAILFAVWVAALLIVPKVAFGRDKVAQALGDSVSGEAQFRSFRNVYFPHPGCIAEGVIIRRSPDQRIGVPLISAAKLTIIGSYSTLLSKHVPWMRADGLVVTPSGGSWPEDRSKSNIVVEHFVADNATLQIPRKEGGNPVKFEVHHFRLDGLGSRKPMPFQVEVTNPLPRGEISASGKLGPWNQRHQDSPVEGSYSLRHADLSGISGIGGILSSDGKFHGSIHELQVTGTTETPQFETTSNDHRFPVSTQFQVQVDGTSGDVILQHIVAKLAETTLDIHGAVAKDGQPDRRTATLDVLAHDGRIQDILFPFVNEPRSPVRGVTSWRAHIVLPSGNEPFRRRVQLNADFGIADALFTNPKTQAKLDKASVEARGNPSDDDPAEVLSDLKGHVVLKNGSADFSQLTFTVPGATAQMHGMYNVITHRVNLHGTVRLEVKMSKATTGVKSFLLKALSPFLKKDKPQEPLPVAITGTYDHPQYSISVTKKQERHGL